MLLYLSGLEGAFLSFFLSFYFFIFFADLLAISIVMVALNMIPSRVFVFMILNL